MSDQKKNKLCPSNGRGYPAPAPSVGLTSAQNAHDANKWNTVGDKTKKGKKTPTVNPPTSAPTPAVAPCVKAALKSKDSTIVNKMPSKVPQVVPRVVQVIPDLGELIGKVIGRYGTTKAAIESRVIAAIPSAEGENCLISIEGPHNAKVVKVEGTSEQVDVAVLLVETAKEHGENGLFSAADLRSVAKRLGGTIGPEALARVLDTIPEPGRLSMSISMLSGADVLNALEKRLRIAGAYFLHQKKKPTEPTEEGLVANAEKVLVAMLEALGGLVYKNSVLEGCCKIDYKIDVSSSPASVDPQHFMKLKEFQQCSLKRKEPASGSPTVEFSYCFDNAKQRNKAYQRLKQQLKKIRFDQETIKLPSENEGEETKITFPVANVDTSKDRDPVMYGFVQFRSLAQADAFYDAWNKSESKSKNRPYATFYGHHIGKCRAFPQLTEILARISATCGVQYKLESNAIACGEGGPPEVKYEIINGSPSDVLRAVAALKEELDSISSLGKAPASCP